MVSLGIMTLQPLLESMYFKSIAKRAPFYNITVYCFHPQDWDPIDQTVTGTSYCETTNAWEYDAFPVPDFVYDRCFYAYKPLESVKQLKRQATFLGNGLPNKWRVYSALQHDPSLKKYLPKTTLLTTSDEAIDRLLHEKSLVLKPVRGSQGNGILFLHVIHGRVMMQTHYRGEMRRFSLSFSEWTAWLERLMTKSRYMVQSFLKLTNAAKQPFDIRVLMQKNTTEIWKECGRGIRKGRSNSLVSNIHNGGTIHSYTKWLTNRAPHKQKLVSTQINDIISILPSVLEKKFGDLYELGIDIGVDHDGHCLLLEANSKPGHQTIRQTDRKSASQLSDNLLAYCLYVNESKNKGAATHG